MTEVRPGGGDPLPAPRCPLPRLDRLTSREGKEGRRGEQTHRAYVTEADEPHSGSPVQRHFLIRPRIKSALLTVVASLERALRPREWRCPVQLWC